jgi:PIN domain nuclease of toxin-antitoxin system
MNLLLDTHALLWWMSSDPELSEEARAAVADDANIVFVSAATAWEMTIKKALGKLKTPDNLEAEMERNNFLPLPITIRHALAVGKLPKIHRDPFDRMLIAQAKVEGLTLVTRDENIRKYKIRLIVA